MSEPMKSAKDILTGSRIADGLATKWAGCKLYCYEETGSTNDDAKRCGEAGDPHGTVVTADFQNAGKGRRGRSWRTNPGTALTFSILLRPSFSAERASMITLVMALAVAEALEKILQNKAAVTIKWPNDIVVNRKKICGILTEMTVETKQDKIAYLVVGVGINVNNVSPEEFPEQIRQTAASLRIETGRRVDRTALLQDVLRRFEKFYQVFLETLDLSVLREGYQTRLQGMGEEVRVLDPAGEYTGVSRGIDDRGELIVERADGERVAVYAGEVSVRGLYSYV
ncbi:MAG: biotin--[acetyl-CoA-carboxylase] ligase [Bacteroidales bacterium]|nr:biotin--[acetyl-CoA-carboxylase] ligase [Bacteroidales bacterium]MCM1415039.1 biotin--[acetyl-CoA-carboxylase] ligase [bacterium]MCM1422893.1 biotin--[acetyl-CoA-carboxylase] ligase [bacterium]